ncbi:hypothetical protein [Micromonospora cathayae]|uniref:Uncharacterized protein n=1 Tax=Micromonospora cathayae TaxID=3028804 RepID=A0ABY7ZJE4_9ACTN|nr:hypothetical protein [Micromonospora sp. HUAS 3]WDZ83008.1 hypothetical protein PVK37_21365 [Micromonospora sp. HUAS 3]
MAGNENKAGRRKPSPLRGILLGVVILLIIPGTRDAVIGLAVNIGWLILTLVILALILTVMVKPRR